MKRLMLSAALCVCSAASFAVTNLFTNGTYITGTNVNGQTISESLAYGTIANGTANSVAGYNTRINAFTEADDFIVPPFHIWTPSTATLYQYQTGSTTTSTMTAVYIQIWNGPPAGGGAVIHGDLTTNRLTGSVWSNVYRVFNGSGNAANLVATNRPVMENTVDLSWIPPLGPGTYWMEVMANGTLTSGPWWVVRTELNTPNPDNAQTYSFGTLAWAPLAEAELLLGVAQTPPVSRARDFMFKVNGSAMIHARTKTRIRGTTLSGSEADIDASDDVRWELRPGVTFSNAQDPIEIELIGLSLHGAPNTLTANIEDQTSSLSVRRKASFFDYTAGGGTGAYVLINPPYDGPWAATNTDQVSTYNLSPALAIHQTSFEMKMKFQYRAIAAVFGYPWKVRIDHFWWDFS